MSDYVWSSDGEVDLWDSEIGFESPSVSVESPGGFRDSPRPSAEPVDYCDLTPTVSDGVSSPPHPRINPTSARYVDHSRPGVTRI